MNAHSVINRIAAGALAVVIALGGYFLLPPPHHAAASFEGPSGWAGTAGGTANALVLNVANVQSLGDLVGVTLHFNPLANNTGPATIAVQSLAGTTSPVAVLRPSSLGLVAFSLNEFWTGETTSVFYNGTNFVLSSNVDMRPIGSTCEFRGSGAPRGCLIEDGSCVSSTQFAALNSVLGTLYGTCSGANVAVPDSRGTMFAALDGQGANGLAGRISATSSCGTSNALGSHCGVQTSALTSVTQFPSANLATSVSDSRTWALTSLGGVTPGIIVVNNGTTTQALSTTGSATSGGVTVTGGSISGTTPTGGSSVPFATLNPILLGLRAIKY